MRRIEWAIAGVLLAAGVSAAAQLAAPTGAGSVVDPYTVRGKVLNGLDGNGVPRALVMLASRKVLTDPQGNFTFSGFTLAKGQMSATKPGFSPTADGSPAPRAAGTPDLTLPVVLRLYPNAVVTGVVTGRDGLPVAGVQVRLVAANLDVTGLRWVQAGGSVTDSHGEYRFNPQPGRYRVSVGYLARTRETGEVVMPVSFPEISSIDKSNYVVVGSGQERRVDLQPRTGIGYPVALKIDEQNVRNVRFTVTTGAGDSFNLPAASEDGEFRLTLPTGTFQVKGHFDSQDSSAEGSTRVTVSNRPGAAVTMQLAPLTSLPLEVICDPASVPITMATASGASVPVTTPNPAMFNLRLHNEKNVGEGVDGDIAPTFKNVAAGGVAQASFRVPPGRYRLEGGGGGNWHVESATYGQTNLLGGEVVIGPGSSGTAIRIMVDNRMGTLQGSVRMPDAVPNAWVYLVAATPSLGVANAQTVIAPGTFSTRLPIGTYNVMALDHQLHVDLRDPEVVKGFSTAVKAVEITADTISTVSLDLAREKGGTE